ncbi:MAG: 3-dehydroquinate synthase [Gemmatimonadales bacterium]
MTVELSVSHALGSYPVRIGAGNLERLAETLEELAPSRRPVVITDQNVGRAVSIPLKPPTLVVRPGEGSKTRNRWRSLTDRMLDLGFGRDTVVVALGGGVVGDLAGFVAATYLRGVPCLQVPTSLLAMVDASVGGKTGLNTRHGKNLVGAFHPPVGVVIDPSVLATLRSRDLRNGLVEAVKHGLIADQAYYDWIDQERDSLLGRDEAALARLVERSVAIKAEVVSADERETGRRAVLNAGHTVAHALERLARYRLSHGEAVAVGLVVEAELAAAVGRAPAGLSEDLERRLLAIGLRLSLPPADADDLVLQAMTHDKKSKGGALGFALPGAPGRQAATPPWTTAVDGDDVRQALGRVRRRLAGTAST